jgi:hypothetical protein
MTLTSSPDVEEQFPRPEPSHSPALLRNHQFAAAVAVLLFGLVALGQLLQLRADLSDQPQLTTQAVRISQLQAEVTQAGRLAAVAAVGGTGSTELEASLKAASTLVVQAAAAGADAGRLAAINASLGEYAHLLRQAAATGSEPAKASTLLTSADKVLTGSLQPALSELQAGIGQQAAAANWLGWALAAGGIAVIAVIAWGWFRSSQLSHRVINPGLAIATVLVAGLTVLVVGTATSASGAASSDAVRQAVDLVSVQSGVETSARLQAEAVLATRFTADQVSAEEEARMTSSKAIDESTPDDVRLAASTAVDNLKDSAALLAKSSWTQAAAILTGASGSTLPNNLSALDKACTAAGDELVTSAEAAPQGAAITLLVAAVGVGVLAVAAAVAVIWGFAARLKEYQ